MTNGRSFGLPARLRAKLFSFGAVNIMSFPVRTGPNLHDGGNPRGVLVGDAKSTGSFIVPKPATPHPASALFLSLIGARRRSNPGNARPGPHFANKVFPAAFILHESPGLIPRLKRPKFRSSFTPGSRRD
jgi:hypothetical protein